VRKFFIILLLLAFFSPVPGPKAHSGTPELCSLKDKSCEKHEKSCPLESHGVSRSSHHDMQAAPAAKKGAPSLKCGCSKHDSGDLVRIQGDPFTTGRLPLPCDSSETPLIGEAALTGSNPLIPIRIKPPAI
jgi:hypothetical protein